MNTGTKRDLSVPMLRANLLAFFIMIPIAILQFSLFNLLNGRGDFSITINLLSFLILSVLVVDSILVHELIHGLTWMVFGKKPFSAVKFGITSLTPYVHLKEPIEVNVYRLGGFMPGFILGILPFFFSLLTGHRGLLWFGLLQTAAASGDWLVLLLLRKVKRGTLVEDHPTRVGCYAYES